MILRPGAVTLDMLEEVIGDVSVDQTILGNESDIPPKAPGMKYRHYAPKAKLVIVEGNIREETLAIRQLAYEAAREGRRIGIIASSETADFYTHGLVKNIGSRENEKTIAKNLYAILREFDEEDVDEIYSESFARQGMGRAIMNRLEKAAGHLRISAAAVVKRQRFHRIVFVSQFDTCRGPMAAELLRQKELKQEYVIESRGMVVLFPEPANQKAEAVMKSMQLTLEKHTAHAFSESEIGEDILILTFEQKQKEKIIAEYGNPENVYTIYEFIGEEKEFESPYGKSLQAYGECLENISGSIQRLSEELNSFTE